jgi:predicted HTH transcriptional regulator
MLTAEFISALLRAEEGETLALKERFGADVIETAVPFANTHGGTILMGVYDEAHITGERWGKEALRDYVNSIATATQPAVVLAPTAGRWAPTKW